MGERIKAKGSESGGERLSRFGRNFNAAVGGVALAGAAIIPGPNILLAGYGYFNLAQAGGFEFLRRFAKNKQTKKHSKEQKT